jgi:FAD synthase
LNDEQFIIEEQTPLSYRKGSHIMANILTGVVNGMRPVGGEVENGPRKGEKWHFLSMEIVDTSTGKVYSCQLRDNDKQYKEMVESRTAPTSNGGGQAEKHFLKQGQDLTGHKVKVRITAQTAGEREIEDKSTGEKTTVLQIRSTVTNIRDLGIPDDEDQ